MPKLDGVSATSLIRKFDCMTPIISMTSNSKPNEILNYFSSGACVIRLYAVCVERRITDRYERYTTKAVHETGSARHVGGSSRLFLLGGGALLMGGWYRNI